MAQKLLLVEMETCLFHCSDAPWHTSTQVVEFSDIVKAFKTAHPCQFQRQCIFPHYCHLRVTQMCQIMLFKWQF